MAVLNPSYNLKKNELIATQAKALMALVKYIELLKQCDAIKSEIGAGEKVRSEIESLFL